MAQEKPRYDTSALHDVVALYDKGELGLASLHHVLHAETAIVYRTCRCGTDECCALPGHQHVSPHQGCLLR